jgi:plasmid stabilization system protein ParE
MAHRLAPQAEAELDAIWYYIATESGSFQVADRFIDSLAERFYMLATSPHLGRRRDEDLILYRIDHQDVLILHVVRGSRDVEALFSS